MSKQKKFAESLLNLLQSDGMAEDVDTLDLLDGLATLGLKLDEMSDTNEASEAYFAELTK